METIKMECEHCGATLEMDMEHMQAYCPYCGNKLTIGADHLGSIVESLQQTKREQFKEEEETKRKEMEYAYKKAEDKSWNRTCIITVTVFFGVFFALVAFLTKAL